ncbi:hypothetical protein D3C85_279840 [compost metagenome]
MFSICLALITCTGDAVSALMRFRLEPVTSTRCSFSSSAASAVDANPTATIAAISFFKCILNSLFISDLFSSGCKSPSPIRRGVLF